MEQTKTDPGRKKKKPLRRCGIFFACLLFLFLCSFVYISKNPRARMLLFYAGYPERSGLYCLPH